MTLTIGSSTNQEAGQLMESQDMVLEKQPLWVWLKQRAKAHGSKRHCCDEIGESNRGETVEPRWVNEKSRDHMGKYQEGMVESHGENVESHPHNEELWNKFTLLNHTHIMRNYRTKSLRLIGSTSHPPIEKDLKQARENDKDLFEEIIEQRKLNGNFFETFMEELKKDTNDKLVEALAQLREQPLTPHSG
ncbi:hypothetical protein Tco_0707657 [Tanacetum coccineum]|uniref:Uncharacterized protein n=1 Tax=Tanacetum coccineum TaxID=301880 RepID=A0ABQ4YAZ7_9ASTR